MQIFSYRSSGGLNRSSIIKGATDAFSIQVDFSDGLPSGTTITSATSAAVDEDNNSKTTEMVTAAGTISGSLVLVGLKTGGTSGTGAATDGARFRVRTTATLSAGSTPLVYDVMVLIAAPVYNPDAD